MNEERPELTESALRKRSRDELWDVVRMSFPIVVATCCRMFMDVTDFWMISRTGDSDALAAILPAQMVMFSYIVIGMGTLSIVTTMASQCLGRNQHRQCAAYGWQCVYISLAFWVVGMALWPVIPGIFRLAGHAATIQNLEDHYAQIAVWTIGPSIAAAGLGSFFNGIHRPSVTMIVALEGIVVNATVSFVLIFGKLGFEPMGIEGAAWGTVVGTHYRAVRLTLWLLTPRMQREFSAPEMWRFDWRKLKTILRFGAPSGLQWFSDVTVWAIFTTVLVGSYFGKIDQLATNAAWQYLRVSFMPAIGVGIAISSIVGKSIGAGDRAGAQRYARIGCLMLLAYMSIMSVIFLTWRASLIGFFSDNVEVIRIGSWVMVCAAVFQVFDALGITYNCALRGAGDTFVPAVVFVVSHWIIVIGGGYVAADFFPELRSVGPWIAAAVLIIVTGVYQWARWRQGAWMRIDVFQYDRAVEDGESDEPISEPVVEISG